MSPDSPQIEPFPERTALVARVAFPTETPT
jgi:hypothetical protein